MNAQGTKEWHADRASVSVTGSICGAIVGDNPYSDFEKTLRTKVREVLGLAPDSPPNALMIRGIETEPEARRALEAETGLIIHETGLHKWPEFPWFGSSPDGITNEHCVEIKCRNTPKPISLRRWEWHQTQAHMTVTGKESCLYWQYDPDTQQGILEVVEFDPTWWDTYRDRFEEFHETLREILLDPKKQQPFIDPLVEQRDDPEWAEAASNYIDMNLALQAAQSAEKKARAALLKLTDKAAEGAGVRVVPVTRVGNVDYSKVPELAGVDLSAYRKPSSTSYRITVKNGTT